MSYRWMLRMDSPHICYLYLLAVRGFCYGAGVLPDRSLVGVIGGSVTFNRASAQPFITLEWKVNGTTIILNYIRSSDTLIPEDGYRDRINLDRSSGSLELMNLDLTDSGQYTVTILTPEAVSVEENTKLEVYESVSSVVITPTNTDLVEFNSSVSLSCSSSGSPPLSYHWLNGSFVVTVSDGVQFGDGNSTLTIVSVTRYDKGPFSCSVSNPVSSDINRQNLTLTISYGPENTAMKVIPSDVHYETGSNLNLSCSAESSPPAQFQWALNGTLLSNKGPELRLGNIQINQSGSYSCWAHNTRTLRYQTSEPSEITVLGVLSSSTVEVLSSENPAHAGNMVTLTLSPATQLQSGSWAVGGAQILTWSGGQQAVFLSHNGSASVDVSMGTLTLTSITVVDSGVYVVQSTSPQLTATSNSL
ncbi:carcinoembryonic antigen-related cell adhesion molecule 5 isoform X2 [Salmo salar]|nr:carcinoembryonic antigen-related cell adhesion molecule 5-like isoform X2 [Salmo salar]|eukprot:XP_014056830.1 PREDICTED: carcinoembryonic antigen-related cell adhesion molecule 5-like [Salmo salar]